MDNNDLGSDMVLDGSDYDEKQLTPTDDDNVAIISPDDADSMIDDADPVSQSVEPLADDHVVMMARWMPPLPDQETEAEVFHTWDITDWLNQPKRAHGPTFHCGGHPWRVLFFPAGNSASDSVSFYLEQGFEGNDGQKPPEGWYACAQFMLVLSNPNDPSIYLHHEAHHRFTAEEGDWGFTRFADKNRIFAPKFEGRERPLIENGNARMTAYVRVLKDPTGVLWHSFINYDSKKETGMVGLRNQGATCYLNSLLQSLYLTGAFRKAVYQIPTETPEEKEASNSAYMLQRLFYSLQADQVAVSTNELTRSFGWESRQIFEQQDVQELSRILMEKLEARMKGTEAENALEQMFVGKMKTYLRCINVEYESSRIEEFWDLQLNVSGCRGLYDSFNAYVKIEVLEGDNKYAAEGFGLQDANKGVIFESFPNVLHLQLKRFEYDLQRDAMMKVNDRYEFPEIFDASPYLDETADKSEPYIYHLHGVLVHSGDLNAGHYYAFLKPEKNGQFYRFDDDRVTRATKREAIDDNFGGDYQGVNGVQKGQNPYTRQWSTKRSNNAYMLVYIRESRLDQIILSDEQAKPPEHLPAKLKEERLLAERRRKEKEEAHLYMNVNVATQSNFQSHDGQDLIPWADEPTNLAAPHVYRVLRSMTIAQFNKYVAEQQGLEADLIRPWIMVNRQNGTVRPDHPLLWGEMTLQEAAEKFSTRSSGFRLYVEETTRDSEGKPIWKVDNEDYSPSLSNGVQSQTNKPIILFLKYFDVDKQDLRGVGHVYMMPTDRAESLAKPILSMMGWQAGEVPIQLYEEIKQNYIEPMKPKNTLVAAEIQDGDIICFQRHLSDAEQTAIRQTNPTACLDAPAFYDFLMNRLFVNFSPKSVLSLQLRTEDDMSFQLALSKKDTYDALAHKVADYLSSKSDTPIEPSHIRFTTTNIQSGKPRAVVKRQQNTTVNHILLGNNGYGTYGYAPSQAPDHLFYEVLEMSLTDLEQRKTVKITWLTEGIQKEEAHDLLVHKQGDFTAVLEALQQRANLPDEIMDQIRFYEVHSNKVYKIIPHTHGVIALNEFMNVYAERIPEEESQLDKDNGDRLLYCFHFEKEPAKAHGVPFIFFVKQGEIFKETKERLSKRTGFKGKNLEKIKFGVVKGGQVYSRPVWIEDDDILSEKLGPDDHLGLEHPNRSRANWARYESLNIR